MPFFESESDFVCRHSAGGLPIRDPHPSRVREQVFASGAKVIWNVSGANSLIEPPTDAGECLHAKRRYRELWLSRIEADFAKLKAALVGSTDGQGSPVTFRWPEDVYGPPKESGTVALHFLKKLFKRHRDALDEIEDAIAALPAVREARQRDFEMQELLERRRREAEQEEREVFAINLDDE